jgi:hypothetical protein
MFNFQIFRQLQFVIFVLILITFYKKIISAGLFLYLYNLRKVGILRRSVI